MIHSTLRLFMAYSKYRYLGAFAALTLTFMSATQAASEKLSQEWQPDRDYYGVVVDLACKGDQSSYRELRRAAVDQENPVAQNNMVWLIGEENCLFQDPDMDLEYAYALQYGAAEAGYPIAINNYGHRLMKGLGIGQSSERAVRYFEWAITKDYGTAALHLAEYYLEGEYIARDYGKAAELLRLARADVGPDEQRPDAHAIADMARMLDAMSAQDAGFSPVPPQSQWGISDTTASWSLVSNGRPSASVFVEADSETGQLYYGFARISNNPMIHFMGASVQSSSGVDQELHFGRCGANNCLETLNNSSPTLETLLRIPIIPSQRDATLEALKSGSTVKFRYQTQDSLVDNNFANYTLRLAGSRAAIEQVERMSSVIANEYNQPQVDYTNQPPVPVTPQASAPIIEQAAGNSSGFFNEDMMEGGILCPASETSEFPPYFYTEFPSSMRDVFEGPYASSDVKPATTDFLLSAGTTVWHSIAQYKVVLYGNGRVAFVTGNSRSGVQTNYEGTWQFDAAKGVQLSVSSVPGLWRNTEHFVCSGGTLAIDQAFIAIDQGIPGTGHYQTCDMMLQCQRWSDGSEGSKIDEIAMMDLYEWSPEIVAVTGLRTFVENR